MEGLFANGLSDLGPCGLHVEVPLLCRVSGPRPVRLRKELERLLSGRPGVYAMVSACGEVIYVGKAKNLRARLLSYFRAASRAPKAGRILRQTASIVWEVCRSEFAALHRELELIRRWRPRWNVQGQPLRRRLTYLCLGRQPAPHVFLAREPPRQTLAVHGPLPAGRRTQEAVRRLNDFFRLRDCPQPQEMIFPEQNELFPVARPAGCLRLDIGTCLGPCTGTCPRHTYRQEVNAARAFLAGRDLGPLARLDNDMMLAARAQNYERAANLRDRLDSFRYLADRLQRLRHAREKMSFIYPVRGWQHTTWWYFIHGGRTLAALPEPHDADSRQHASRKMEEVYRDRRLSLLLDSYEHVDSMLLVSSWFRKFPAQRNKALDPAEILRQWDEPEG